LSTKLYLKHNRNVNLSFFGQLSRDFHFETIDFFRNVISSK